MAGLNANPTFKVTPTSTKVQLQSNYVSVYDYSSVYAPEHHDELAQIFGKQSVAGMLHMLGAESSFSSDQFIWSEEGRLHTVYKDVARTGNVFTKAGHVFRKNELIHLSANGVKRVGLITAVTDDTFTAIPYKSAGFTALGATAITAFVFGSEFRKGTKGMEGSLETQYSIYRNKPIIMKDKFEVNGSDATNIGWIQTEDGGWLWYLQSEKDTRRRWEDRLELAMFIAEKADTGSEAEIAGYGGTEGGFEAIRTRGNTYQGLPTTLADWDTILKRFDAQGKIQDYMAYVDRDFSLGVDNLLGQFNAGYEGGVSYGIFNNNKDMCLNLGFKGFTRGTYNFFKTDWKLLNDPTLLGAVEATSGKVRGLLVPIGTKEVYEGAYNGTGDADKITTPFLQVKYKQAGNENRKMKSWVTGSVGMSAPTDDEDVMRLNMLSERMLVTVGANNFMLFEGN